MDEEVLQTIKRVLIGVIIALLLAGMTLVLFRYRADMNSRSRRIASLTAQANAYETELNDLRRQQELEEMHLYTPEGPGVAVIAFLIDGEESLSTAVGYGQAYGFEPSILLRADDPNVDSVIESMAGAGLDVILYSRGIGTAA